MTGLDSGWLVQASWQAAVLGLLVYLASWLLNGRLEARWRYWLWLAVLARLALPVLPTAPWSLFGLVGREAPVPNNPADVQPARSSDRIAADRTNESAQVATSRNLNQDNSAGTNWTTAGWLSLIWLGVVVSLLARQMILHMRLHFKQRIWQDVSDPTLQELYRTCREEMRIFRPVRFQIALDDSGPATSGAFRVCIVMPQRLVAVLPREDLRLVLLHELAHVRRRDILLDRVASVLVIVHWFNPVAWLALGCLRRERELACDAAVLLHLGGHESSPYAHALLRVAGELLAPATLPGAVGVIGKNRSLVRRIHMIVDYTMPTRARKALGGVLLLALAAFGLTDAMAVPAELPDDRRATPVSLPAQAVDGPVAADATFETLYSLPDGEILKRVALPFPPSRLAYFRKNVQEMGIPNFMSFHWKNGKLHQGLMNVGFNDAPSGTHLPTLFEALTAIYPQDLEGDETLIKDQVITGDFIVRAGAPKEKVVARLEEILRQECKLPIKLSLREVERPVMVARGTFRLTPIEGYQNNQIQLYGKQLVPNSGAGGGTDTFDEFIQHAGSWTARRVASEAANLPKEIVWRNHAVSPFTEEQRREDHDPELVFQHISEQTGLTFKEENRKVRVLFVERVKER